ncbi:MFS transporter [Amycolatopsis sp. cg9]|uniref:MFS transporter n=1 Tax=Amycolatopsis sp. cg9 TaxID=3238801 RepID=UPI003525035F
MPLGVYRAVLAIPHVRGFFSAGLVARLPTGMRAVACLLLISATTGSYTLAGAVSGVLGVAESAGVLVLARQADRRGQRPVVLGSLAAHVVALVALVAAVSWALPAWTYFAAAVVAGLATAPYGSFVRARWAAAAESPDDLRTAYAMEAVFDEIFYIVGPLLAVALATRVWPGSALLAAAVLVSAGGLALASQRRTEPAPGPHAGSVTDQIVRVRGMWVVGAVCFFLGSYVGALDPAMIAFAEQHGAPGLAGVLLATLTVASMLAGIGFGARKWSWSQPRLLVAVTTLLCACTVPPVFADGIGVMAGCAFVAGLGIAPVTVTAATLVSSLVARSALTTGFAVMGSATGLGIAAGAAVSGALIDSHGITWAFLFTTLTTGAGIVVSLLGRNLLGAPPREITGERPAPVGR